MAIRPDRLPVHRLQLRRRDQRARTSPSALCSAAFSECDGLEMTMDVKTHPRGRQQRPRRSGSPGRRLRAADAQARHDRRASTCGTGSSAVVARPGAARRRARSSLLAADGSTERARFVLTRCLPVKLKAPPLNAKDGVRRDRGAAAGLRVADACKPPGRAAARWRQPVSASSREAPSSRAARRATSRTTIKPDGKQRRRSSSTPRR